MSNVRFAGDEPAATDAGSCPRCSAIMPVYNARRYLGASIEALDRAVRNYGNADLIVIDNGSTDGSLEFVRQRYGGAVKLHAAQGTVSAVRNHGARQSTAEFLAFVDADCVVPVDYLQRAATVLAATGADATGSSYALPANPHWIEATWHHLHDREADGPVHHINAGNFVISRKAFESVGGFDPALTSGEDAELCLRLTQRGFRLHASREVSAIHLGNPKTLRQFFAQQTWHGLGTFGTFRHAWADRPLIMSILHAVLSLSGLCVLLWAPLSIWQRLALAALLWLAVPSVTVLFRAMRGGKVRRPLAALVLYYVYFAARLTALWHILTGKGLRHSRTLAGHRSASSHSSGDPT